MNDQTDQNASGDLGESSGKESSQVDERRYRLGLFGILALALALRLYRIQDESPWGDEALTLLFLPATSLRDFLQQAVSIDSFARLAPLFYTLEYIWSKVAGAGPLAMRLMSVTFGIATIALVVGIARRLFDDRTGLISGALCALSLVHVYYSQEVRFYSLLAFWAALSMYGFVRATTDDRPARWWCLNLLANAAALWTHIFAPLLFLPQGLYLAYVAKKKYRSCFIWCAAHVAVLAVFAAWVALGSLDDQTAAPYFREAPPGWRDIAATTVIFSGGRVAEEDPAAYMPGGISFDLPIAGVSVLLLVFGCSGALRKPSRDDPRPATVLLLVSWLVAPLLGLFVLSHVWRMVFYYRYAIYCLFAFQILVAAGLSYLKPPKLRQAALALLVLGLAYQFFALQRPIRPDYSAMAETIEASPAPTKRVISLKWFNALGVDYALGVSADEGEWFHGYPELCSEVVTAAIGGEEVWVIFHRWDRTSDFESRMTGAGLSWNRHEWGGQPPLIGYRVTGGTSG